MGANTEEKNSCKTSRPSEAALADAGRPSVASFPPCRRQRTLDVALLRLRARFLGRTKNLLPSGRPSSTIAASCLFNNYFRAYELLWDGIVPASMKGMAAQDALDSKPSAFSGAVFFNRFHRVCRAGRDVAARRGKQRRDCCTIKLDEEEQQLLHCFAPFFMSPAFLQSATKDCSTSWRFAATAALRPTSTSA